MLKDTLIIRVYVLSRIGNIVSQAWDIMLRILESTYTLMVRVSLNTVGLCSSTHLSMKLCDFIIPAVQLGTEAAQLKARPKAPDAA